jgi:hypothetical protein
VHTADLQTLWKYHAWANRQIVAAVASLPAPALQTPVASGHVTLFATLLHMLDADYGWRMLLQHNTETPLLSEVDVSDLATLADRFLDEAAAMRQNQGGAGGSQSRGCVSGPGQRSTATTSTKMPSPMSPKATIAGAARRSATERPAPSPNRKVAIWIPLARLTLSGCGT